MSLLLWLLWVAIAIQDLGEAATNQTLVANNVNYCEVTKTNTETVVDKCSSGLTYLKQGYLVDKVASNLTQYTDLEISAKLNEWFLSARITVSPNCTFFRLVDKTVVQCCQGWTGDSCQNPVCIPACSQNGKCVSPNLCKCNTGYVGQTCTDQQSAIKKYCYMEATCVGGKPTGGSDVMSQDDCCNKFLGRGWGVSDGTDCVACSGIQTQIDISNFDPEAPTVIKNLGNLPFRTCVGSGPNYYRTFDGLEFTFPGRCSYVLFSDGIRTVTLETINCQLYTQCKKKLTFNLNGKDEIVVQGSSILDGGISISVNSSNGYASLTSSIHIELKGDYYYLEYGTLRARWDTGNSWFLTLQEPLSASGSRHFRGICGNFDGDALNDLLDIQDIPQTPIEFGNSWAVAAEDTTCKPATSTEIQCANDTQADIAKKACSPLLFDPFSSCQKAVDVKSFYARCVNDYCTVLSQSVTAKKKKVPTATLR